MSIENNEGEDSGPLFSWQKQAKQENEVYVARVMSLYRRPGRGGAMVRSRQVPSVDSYPVYILCKAR